MGDSDPLVKEFPPAFRDIFCFETSKTPTDSDCDDPMGEVESSNLQVQQGIDLASLASPIEPPVSPTLFCPGLIPASPIPFPGFSENSFFEECSRHSVGS